MENTEAYFPEVEDDLPWDKHDAVEHPVHYTNTSIECIDAMTETQGDNAVINFCVCNAFKYLWRHNSKNGFEDIKKAAWYLNKAVNLYDSEKEDQHEESSGLHSFEKSVQAHVRTDKVNAEERQTR